MADEWNSKAAIKKLKKEPEAFVCDILLDQQIFSGVGNIIKNEVLYRIRVHPLTRIENLPPAKLKALVKEARNYSFDFLKWKKENALSKHWEVYSQKECPASSCNREKRIGQNSSANLLLQEMSKTIRIGIR
jgi:endonuclease-8